ncbi:MAG: sulfotransferase [Acidimicrobiales bacterium]
MTIAPVHIDDYAAPEFTPEVAEMIAMAAPLADALPLEVDAICDQAVADLSASGRTFDDFGDEGFREPMAALLAAYDGLDVLSPMGRITVHTLFSQLCRNRLLIADLLAQHPEIHDVEIAAPIIIAGLPRTGTTHLHNLLAADPALRSLPYWESCEPVPLPTDITPPGGVDPRWERTAFACEFLNSALPYFKRMHEMTPDHVHEEIQLLAIDFSSMLFETLAPVPAWRDRFLATDQTPHYEYLKTVLKVLTFLRGGERWVLKSPQHLEQYRAIMSVFPDATVVVTHRDPVAVTASMATMLCYTSRMQVDPVRPAEIGQLWMDRLHRMLGSAMRDRDTLPEAQSMDVRFDDFMADDLGTVARIYELAGQQLDDRARTAHATYLTSHQRERHGGLIYDLSDFGIDPDECAAGFEAYVTRFLR